jgi:hypothetical protein
MQPIWSTDVHFEYNNSPTIESLATKYLVIECYGAEAYLGVCRIDLYAIASGPRNLRLTLREGHRDNGTVEFDCHFELVTTVTIQFTRVLIQQLPALGYEGNPNPYLTFGLVDGEYESAVAPNARVPEWSALPPLHFKGTYYQLAEQKALFRIKHSRNGYTSGITDPQMASFEVDFSRLPIEPRGCLLPFREMAHSLPSYPYPFSAECSGVIEFRNVHPIVQLRGGLRTDHEVVGGIPPTAQRSSPPRQRALPPLPVSPDRSSRAILTDNHTVINVPRSPAMPSQTLPLNVPQTYSAAVSYSAPSAPYSAPVPTAAPADLELLEEVTAKQSSLLLKVQTRLEEVLRKKQDVLTQISSHKIQQENMTEAASQRKIAIDNDLRSALQEKDRLEEAIRNVQLRREEESRVAAHQAVERERARKALEEEQQEAVVMQQRVVQLRNEMTRHLEEEERRYQIRVREAEESRRRTLQDADALAALESRIADAESRAMMRSREEQARSVRRVQLSSPPRQR